MVQVLSHRARTALILGSIALAFFIGIIARYWIWG